MQPARPARHVRTRTMVRCLVSVAIAGGALAGCGSSGDVVKAPASATSATTPASGSASPASARALPSGNDSSGIGAWPSFLPSPSAGGVPTGSVDSPAMSYPGNAIVLRIGGASVKAMVDGPEYPTTTPVGAPTVDCTFRLVLTDASAPISLAGASFNVLDSQGGIHQLRATIPAHLDRDQRMTVTIRGVLPAGEGLLRFYPTTAGAVAAWDYIAEDD